MTSSIQNIVLDRLHKNNFIGDHEVPSDPHVKVVINQGEHQ